MFLTICAVFVAVLLVLTIFKWDWTKEHMIRGKKAHMYEWIEAKWGEKAERLLLCGICVFILVCYVLAVINNQI